MVIEGLNYLSEHGIDVTITFEATEGTPFEGGTTDVIEVTGTVISNTQIELMSPEATSDTTATVTVTLPGGLSGTSVPGLSELAGGFLGGPEAVNDGYPVIGNVQLSIPAATGVLLNDSEGSCEPEEEEEDEERSDKPGSTSTQSNHLTVVSFDAVSAQGGAVNVSPDGSFTYNPPAGFRGTDTFDYEMTNGTENDTATVSLTVSQMVWFINDQAPIGGDGRFTSPFNTLFEFDAIQGTLAQMGDIIFVYRGSGNPYDGGVRLLDMQSLVGEFSGLTVSGTPIVPPGPRPIITNQGLAGGEDVAAPCVVLGSVCLVTGLDITSPSGDGILGDGVSGPIDIDRVTITDTGERGIALISCDGTFNIGDFTTANPGDIINPGRAGLYIEDLGATGVINFNGSIFNNTERLVQIDTTAIGSQVNIISTGMNILSSNNNPLGGIDIFDADGDLTFTTPINIINPGFSGIFSTDGDSTWSFTDVTVTGQTGLNGCLDMFAHNGTINLTNLTLSTNSAGTGDGVTGFLMGGNNVVNVLGSNNTVVADGGAAIAMINIDTIDVTFQTVTSTNNLTTQVGFAGDDGVDLLGIPNGSFAVTGTMTVNDADGVGLSVENVGASVTVATFNADTIGRDAVASGVAVSSTGQTTINGGTVNNVTFDGLRAGSTILNTGGNLDVSNVTFTNIGTVISVANSTLAGSGNSAVPFTCFNGSGNTGSISFNGGADSCGQ